jgi:hypothetical protein
MPHGLNNSQLAALRGESGNRITVEDAIKAKVLGEHRGLSFTASMKAAPAMDMSPYAVYVASQTAAIKARKSAGELGAGGVLRAAAPVLDALQQVDNPAELNGDSDLNEALKELHALLAGEDDSGGEASGNTATKSASVTGGGDPAPYGRDPFGKRQDPAGNSPAGRDFFGRRISEDEAEDDGPDGGMIEQPHRSIGVHGDILNEVD